MDVGSWFNLVVVFNRACCGRLSANANVPTAFSKHLLDLQAPMTKASAKQTVQRFFFEFKKCADPPKPGPAYRAVLRAAILGFKAYLCTHFLSDSDTYPLTSAPFRRSPGGGSSGRWIHVALGLRMLLCGGFVVALLCHSLLVSMSNVSLCCC